MMKTRKKVLIGAGLATVVAATAIALAVLNAPEMVSEAEIKAILSESRGPAVDGVSSGALDTGDELPPADVVGLVVTDITDDLSDRFSRDLAHQGHMYSGDKPLEITLVADECLVDWAIASLPETDGLAGLGVQEVCGRDVVVLAGGFGLEPGDMFGQARFEEDRSDLRDVLFGVEEISFAAVTTEGGTGVLYVAG